MKILKYILVLTVLIVTSCKSQVEKEIEKAHEIVEQAIQETSTKDWKDEQTHFDNVVVIENDLNIKINHSKDKMLIAGKDSVIAICNLLLSELKTSKTVLEEKHGLDTYGELNNKMETEYVNEIFLEQKRGQKIKVQIQHTISKLEEISNNLKLGITKEEIPLKLNLSMEKKGNSWENHIFKDMPAFGVMPIFQKYERDIVLTKLIILEKIEVKSN